MTEHDVVVAVTWIAAAFIGFVVSLDVSGLLLSQHQDFQRGQPRLWLKIILNAALHAATHALLFLGYFYLVAIPIERMAWLFGFLNELEFLLPEINAREVRSTILLLSALVIIIFVWITYAQKIVEKHSKKIGTGESPLAHSRIDIRVIYWAFSKLIRFSKFLTSFALALAVAVDMLAISSFIRVFFISAADAENPQGVAAGADPSPNDMGAQLPHFDFGVGNPNIEPFVFATVVFAMVFLTAICAILASQGSGGKGGGKGRFFLRLLEPFFVFWFLVVAVDHLFGLPMESLGQYAVKVFLGLFVSLALTALLVLMHGRKAILDAVGESSDFSLDQIAKSGDAILVDEGLKRSLGHFAIAITAIFVICVGIFYVTHRPGIGHGEGFKAFLDALAIFASLITVAALYIPWNALTKAENTIDSHIFSGDPRSGNRAMTCSFAAYFVILFYIHVSYVGTDILTRHPEEGFIVPLVYVGGIGLATCLLAFLRAKRHFSEAAGGSARGMSVGEMLTAFAIAIFVLQFVQKLMGG